MQFFRVDHATETDDKGVHVGPYSGIENFFSGITTAFDLFVFSEAISAAHIDPYHPPPDWDDIYNIHWSEYCGFSSLDDLFQWFDDYWVMKLSEHDFRVRVYEIDETFVREGRHQAVAMLQFSTIEHVFEF